MKVTLIMVTSLDGKTTEGDKPGAHFWASPEDQKIFKAQIAAHDLLVMGRATYEAARSIMRPNANKPRIVLTRTPHAFEADRRPGLIFSDSTPEEIVKQAKDEGHHSVLLVGGATTNARFFKADLIDEVMVTIEPLLFGAGRPFVTGLKHPIQLKLKECRQLNKQGTFFMHYFVQKNNQGASNEASKI